MTGKEKLFVTHYLVSFNATKAARAAGYAEGDIGQAGYNVLHRTHIQAAIDKRIDAEGMTRNRIVSTLSKIAFAAESDEIEERVSTGDSLSALDKLAKVKGMYTENVNHSGNLTIDQLINSFDDDLAENPK